MGVSIVSLLETNRDADKIKIYIVNNKISQHNKQKIVNLIKTYKRDVCFVEMPDFEKVYGVSLIDQGWTVTPFARLFLTELLSCEIERALYLDCDTLVMDSITNLYNTDIEDFFMAGVIDGAFEKKEKMKIGLTDADNYFNTGVLLINIHRMRKFKIVQNFIDLISSYGKLPIPYIDQGVINATISKQMKVLPLKYNVTTQFIFSSYEAFRSYYRASPYYDKSEYMSSLSNPVIIHFVTSNRTGSRNRPWIKGCTHLYAIDWLKYKAKSPWAEIPLRNNKISWILRIRLVLRRLSVALPIPYPLRRFYRNTLKPLIKRMIKR
jgi:lipopolysaccharide biosynthesis glycosyltransferase